MAMGVRDDVVIVGVLIMAPPNTWASPTTSGSTATCPAGPASPRSDRSTCLSVRHSPVCPARFLAAHPEETRPSWLQF